jgi:hypothetical protein
MFCPPIYHLFCCIACKDFHTLVPDAQVLGCVEGWCSRCSASFEH